MKYLFFDVEFATCYGAVPKMCEFGYVLTDENFNFIEQDNLIICPNIARNQWDFYTVKKILTKTMKEYNSSPMFSTYYPKIKNLFEQADEVFGHSIESDVTSLNGECERYHLPLIPFTIHDNKKFFQQYNKLTNEPGVMTILQAFDIEPTGTNHDASWDAYNTMLGLQAMLENYNLTLQQFIDMIPAATIPSSRFNVAEIRKAFYQKQRIKAYNAKKAAEKHNNSNKKL